MRYYLDTNVLVAMLQKQTDTLSVEVRDILEDYANILYTSSESVHELIHLIQVQRIRSRKHETVTAAEVLDWLDRCGILTVYVNRTHMQFYSEIPIVGGHTDPQDRLIIAQAITDRIPIISSDLRFPQYTQIGLRYIPSK